VGGVVVEVVGRLRRSRPEVAGGGFDDVVGFGDRGRGLVEDGNGIFALRKTATSTNFCDRLLLG
jgi:hypothetical protein